MEKNLKYINLDESEIPENLFINNRKRLFNLLKNHETKDKFNGNSAVVLEGGKMIMRYDTDIPIYHFIQESYFYYLTGINEPDCYLILDLNSENIFVFGPEKTIHGIKILNKEQFIPFLLSLNKEKYYTLAGKNSDSGSDFKKFDFEAINLQVEQSLFKKFEESNAIYEIFSDCRVIKSEEEIEVLKLASKAGCEAHVEVMKNIKNFKIERDAENCFVNFLKKNYYTRDLPYFPICGCGESSATLHYQKNDTSINPGEIFLLDMGAKIGGYISDITITVPVSGKYSKEQAYIYSTVLEANREVMKELKDGVKWVDMHLIAEKVILTNLKKIGLLNDYPVDEMLENRVGYYFMPHGLGHFVGIDVHDVGGYLSFTELRDSKPGLRSLRIGRKIRENMVLTVEPGCYFRNFLLEKAFNDDSISKYFNQTELKKYYSFGGVRIEDVVLVRKNDCLNLCLDLPRTVEEVENIMGNN